MTNNEIARKLQEHARELEMEGGNLFRARACRQAAFLISGMTRPLLEVLEESGREGLEALPGVGQSLGYTLEVLLRTGELRSLRSESDRELAGLPGIGARALERMRDHLGIRSLEDVQAAARDGRLGQIQLSPARRETLLREVEARLRRRREGAPLTEEPSVAELLAVDEEYRASAERGELPTLAPRAFNPEGEKWLGVLNGQRGGWRLRALFSNTALAHRLGKTRDWVVVYFHNDTRSGQRTIVTEARGDLKGRRVVRGREAECRRHYETEEVAA